MHDSDIIIMAIHAPDYRHVLVMQCCYNCGIFSMQKASAMELSAGLDHNLYTPLPVRGRTISSPTPFCFIMKVNIIID